ncbi:MAG: RES domain-containing protein [Deltaproteobacteria bacterium]|nr:RES domain-containing protein [Deltaproteobacteria bacterium]
MKITAWRITNKRHSTNAFSGEGAKLFGGRWNLPGYVAVYAADSLSLAILELIVHLDEDEDIQDYVAIPVEFEDTKVISWHQKKLPKNWPSLPISDQTQHMGKTWIEEKQSLVLKVPSSVVHHDNNFVINPLHPDFSSLKIGQPQALQIDPRLTNRLQ